MTYRNFDALFDDVTKVLSAPYVNKRMGRAEYVQHKTDEGYRIQVPAIGAVKENALVEVENNVLRVTVKPSVDSAYAREFDCSWTLPDDVDTDSVDAKLENGLLTVLLKSKKALSKKVTVAVA